MMQPPPPASQAPRVAVIVPAYGVAHLLNEALGSLQAQTFSAWECIVIDDGAPDDVAGAVAPFLADARIRFLPTDNRGVSAARNRAIRASRAPLITLLDGDDLLRPTYLASMLSLLDAAPTARIATCNARLFGCVPRTRLCVERPHSATGSLADVLDRSFNVHITSTFRRADFDSVGGFDETMAQSEDFDFWISLMLLGGQARYVDAVLCDYRIRPGSASANSGRMLLGNIRVYEKAAQALPAQASEQHLLLQLIDETRTALNFEHAIDRIIDGDTYGGLSALRANSAPVRGAKWRLMFLLWRLWPASAQPLLRWRRRAHSRGSMGQSLLSNLRALRK